MAKIKTIGEFPKSDLYKFFAQNPFVQKCISEGRIFQSYWQGQYSNNSCSFMDVGEKVNKVEIRDNLKDIFGIKGELFDRKYAMAISGDGQEYRRISTLHSSSLVALLCFYSVSEDRPLTMDIDDQTVEFSSSLFEQKSLVGKDAAGKEHNSNMDVVLYGSNTHGESVILYLESKFSEYLSHGKCDQISGVYNSVYKRLTAEGQPIDGLEIVHEGKTWSISAAQGCPQQYCQGIKQMISHYQGVRKESFRTSEDGFAHIYLGEILFKFPEDVDNRHESYDSYSGLYRQLACALNNLKFSVFPIIDKLYRLLRKFACKLNIIKARPTFKVLETSLSYQDVLRNFRLDDNVREFYKI